MFQFKIFSFFFDEIPFFGGTFAFPFGTRGRHRNSVHVRIRSCYGWWGLWGTHDFTESDSDQSSRLRKIPSSTPQVNMKFSSASTPLKFIPPISPFFRAQMLKKYEENMKNEGNMKEIWRSMKEGAPPPLRSTERSEVRVVKRDVGLRIVQSPSFYI